MSPPRIIRQEDDRWPFRLGRDWPVDLPGLEAPAFVGRDDHGTAWAQWDGACLMILAGYASDGVTTPCARLRGPVGWLARAIKTRLDGDSDLLTCALIHDALLQCAASPPDGFGCPINRTQADAAFAAQLRQRGVRHAWLFRRAVRAWSFCKTFSTNKPINQ